MVAHCDVSPVLELGKGVFYPAPRLVQFLVVFDFRLSVAAPGNAWLDVPSLETAADLVGVVAAVADETLGPPISHVGQHLVADVAANIAAGQVKADGSALGVRYRLYLGGPSALALSDGAFAPNSHRQSHRGAVVAREARVDHRDARLGIPAGQDLKDPVPNPVQGIAHEHVVGGLVFSVPRRHVPPAASVPQNIQYAVQRLL